MEVLERLVLDLAHDGDGVEDGADVKPADEDADRALEERAIDWLAVDPEHWPISRLVLLDAWQEEPGRWREEVPRWVRILAAGTVLAHFPHDPYWRRREMEPGAAVNALAESFDARVRDDCLGRRCFASPEEAPQAIEARRIEENTGHLARAPGQQTPAAWAAAWGPLGRAPTNPRPRPNGGRLCPGESHDRRLGFRRHEPRLDVRID